MKATTEVEVVPIWFIKKWVKENSEEGSPLSIFIEAMLKDWKIEEKQNESNIRGNRSSCSNNNHIMGTSIVISVIHI